MKVLFCALLICFTLTSIEAQDFVELKRVQDSIYQSNIKKSRIGGVYIPKSMEDAFTEIDNLSPLEARNKFKNAPEEVVARKLHFGLGNWIKVNWNFEEGSRLAHIIKSYKVVHPDDMVNFMLRSYHRYLNNIDQEYDKRAKEYVTKRASEFNKKKYGQ